MKKVSLICLFACLAISSVYGQLAPSQTNASSGSVSVKNGDNSMSGLYSTDLFSGTVNVTVPIYNYSVDNVNLGVTLTYGTGGIKVDDVASEVGLGWSLNTGGSITREVRGIEDELTYLEIDTLGTGTSYALAVAEQRGYLVNSSTISTTATSDPQIDKEPDIFTVSLNGESFTFSLHDYTGGNVFKTLISPKSNYVVDVFWDNIPLYCNQNGMYHYIPCSTPSTTPLLYFKIMDSHGNQYFFRPDVIQSKLYNFKTFHSTTDVADNIYKTPSSWVLSKVITHKGSTIIYDYTNENYNYAGNNDQRVRESEAFSDSWNYFPGQMEVINSPVNISLNHSKISSITYPNGDIVRFNTDGNLRLDVDVNGGGGNPMAISSITVENGYDATVHNMFAYKFNYAYFNADNSAPELSYPANASTDPLFSLRLKLLGIDKIGTDGTTTENYYSFDYYTDVVLPKRLSNLSDYYGYSNYIPNYFFKSRRITPGEI